MRRLDGPAHGEVSAGVLLFFLVCSCFGGGGGRRMVLVCEDGSTADRHAKSKTTHSLIPLFNIHTHKSKPKPHTGPTASRTPSSNARASWATPSTPPAAPPPPPPPPPLPLPPPMTATSLRFPPPPRPLFFILLTATASTRRLPCCARWTGPPPSFGGWRVDSRGRRRGSRQ